MSDQFLTIQSNVDVLLSVVVDKATLTADGLSGYENVWFLAKRSLNDSDGDAKITKVLGSGITITTDGSDTVDGLITISLDPADTSSLGIGNKSLVLSFAVKAKDANGKDWPLCNGKLTVQPNAVLAS